MDTIKLITSDLGEVSRRDGGGAQPEAVMESTPIFLMILNVNSDIVQASSKETLEIRRPYGGEILTNITFLHHLQYTPLVLPQFFY